MAYYLFLFNGTKTLPKQTEVWAFTGPIIGPVHINWTAGEIRLMDHQNPDSDQDGTLREQSGHIYFNGDYYMDFEIIDGDKLSTYNDIDNRITHSQFIKLNKSQNEWTLTDSDTGQYGCQLNETSFLFFDNETEETAIDIAAHTVEEIEGIINSYGYTLSPFKDGTKNIYSLYPTDAAWIIAECIFETNR